MSEPAQCLESSHSFPRDDTLPPRLSHRVWMLFTALTPEETARLWIDLLENEHSRARNNVTIASQIRAMKLRLQQPFLVLGWAESPRVQGNLTDTLRTIQAAAIHRTSSKTHWQIGTPNASDNFATFEKDLEQASYAKDMLLSVIVRSSTRLNVADHILYGSNLECPIYAWLCHCDLRHGFENQKAFIQDLEKGPCIIRSVVEQWFGAPFKAVFGNYVD